MEEKINIAEILKDKPKGIRLYSPIFGECAFSFVREETDDICVKKHNGEKELFNSKGLYNILGECLLFPSKEMRDWRKFAWKKGDVLISVDERYEIIFDKFVDDTYMSIVGKHCMLDEGYCGTTYIGAKTFRSDYFELQTEDTAKALYCAIEAKLGGKLNRETLEVEKAQPEFKDGDILLYKSAKFTFFSSIFILDTNRNEMSSYVRFSIGKGSIDYDVPVGCNLGTDRFRYATKEEQQQLFDALAKEGKAWDAEKKQIVDLKPKVELKPFDKVLVKDSPYGSWEPALFWKKVDVKDLHPYKIIGGKRYRYCEPYEGNEHLLDN